MRNSSFHDMTEWIGENKLSIAMGVLALVAIGNFFMGGGDRLTQKMNLKAKTEELTELKERTAAAQKAAEDVFNTQGATAQVLSRETRTTNIRNHEVVIDPASVTPQNPQGTIINGGFVVSRDGSVFSVDDQGMTTLIGTSPNIRNTIVHNGMAQGAAEMEANARKLAKQLGIPTRSTGFTVNQP